MIALIFSLLMILFYVVFLALILGMVVVLIIANWKLFQKAGFNGWEAVVPFYSNYVYSKVATGNGIWFLLLLIPYVNFVVIAVMNYRLVICFGKDTTFAVLSIFFPYVTLPMLAFSKQPIEYDASKAKFF